MTILSESRGPVTVLVLSGDALGGPDGAALHEAIRALPAPPLAVVDLADVRHLNSSGLGMLIGAHASAKAAGGGLALARPSARTATLLDVTRLRDVLPTFDTVDAAVDALSP